jgi:hypothetical protein
MKATKTRVPSQSPGTKRLTKTHSVMYQHQNAPLPLERLKDVPQPVVVLLEKLLEKDPAQRFQTPNELLKAVPRITDAIDAGRRIARQSLQKTPFTASRVGARKPPVKLGPEKISVARLPVTGRDLFGREEDLAFLDRAWANKHINLVTIVAWARVGKSTLVNHWLRQMAAKHYRSAELVFGWSFYRQGTSGQSSSADEFFHAALAWFGDPDPRLGTGWEKGERLAKLVAHRRTLLVLDGLEPAPKSAWSTRIFRDNGCRGDSNRGFLLRSHQNRKGAEVGFGRETYRSYLRGISSSKSERVRRTWIPTTSLVNHPIPGSHKRLNLQRSQGGCCSLPRSTSFSQAGPPPAGFLQRANESLRSGFSGSGKVISKRRKTAIIGRSE